MIEFIIFNRKIYLDKNNGDVSFDETSMINKFKFYSTEISKHYKVKYYTFYFSVVNDCNFSCTYLFNKHKDGLINNNHCKIKIKLIQLALYLKLTILEFDIYI